MKPELAQKRLDDLKKRKQRSDFWRPTPGDNHVRFLPRWDGDYDGEMFRETAYHRNLGPDKDKSAVCLRHEGQEKCPVCEVIAELYKTKTDEDKEFARSIKAQTRAIFNIIDLDEPEKGPQIYMSGVDVMEQILRYVANPKYGAIDNPQTGRNCLLVYTEGKNTKSGFPDTNIQADPDTSPLQNMEWLEKLADLDAIVKAMSYDELHALLWGEEVEKPVEKPAEQPKEAEKEAEKPKTPPPPCFEKGKFSADDAECIACFYAKPCEEKKKANKPVEKPAQKPAPAALKQEPAKEVKGKPAGEKSESVKDLLGKLKAKKKDEEVPF